MGMGHLAYASNQRQTTLHLALQLELEPEYRCDKQSPVILEDLPQWQRRIPIQTTSQDAPRRAREQRSKTINRQVEVREHPQYQVLDAAYRRNGAVLANIEQSKKRSLSMSWDRDIYPQDTRVKPSLDAYCSSHQTTIADRETTASMTSSTP